MNSSVFGSNWIRSAGLRLGAIDGHRRGAITITIFICGVFGVKIEVIGLSVIGMSVIGNMCG